MAAERNGRRQTGGGPAPPGPSTTTEWLQTIMGDSISGHPSIYDSDTIDQTPTDITQSESVTKDQDLFKVDNTVNKECIPITSQNLNYIEDSIQENIPNINEDITVNKNVFDSSTPKSMLLKPVSKELLTSCSKRKSAFTPLETRKRIIKHVDKKMDYKTLKQERDKQLLECAMQEHQENLRHKEEIHVKTLSLMEEKHKATMEQQNKIHYMEVDFQKEL